MPLRCLLFSSNEEMVQPIWQVLTDLGIEGEYCQNAVDAVERVTTQLFQIVITDWDDQPEATFLLKTARDLKAAQRPLTLAIVSDDARLPEALQAGANSVLLKPIRVEQVRDTMSTACELLRAKQPSAMQPAAVITAQPEVPATAAIAAAAAVSTLAPDPIPEKTFRAGEFLQSASSAPGPHFDTECEVQKSLDQAAGAEVDALTELEPMASAVVKEPAAEPAKPEEPLTGWAALQSRLTRSAPPPSTDPAPANELLSYGETPSHAAQSASPNESKDSAPKNAARDSGHEAALFAYMAGESKDEAEPAEPKSKQSKIFLMAALAVACVVIAAAPRTRQRMRVVYRNALHAGRNWLNPQPVAVPPAVAQHESFGQDNEEYKLPVAANIPDATTDPSQIRVLPVIDPTVKPKDSEANGSSAATGESAPSDQGENASGNDETPQAVETSGKEQTPASTPDAAGSATVQPHGESSPVGQALSPPAQGAIPPQQPQPRPITAPAHSSLSSSTVTAGSSTAIPSSLRSQTASMTPEASGAKPVEAGMSSIEPVNLPESAAWDLLAQPVDAVYPDSAKAAGQRGSVVLQVLIGRDGTVQDAKFLQGSLVFARAAISAVKQWRFKPYSLNGRAVSVQSSITLNFKPPA